MFGRESQDNPKRNARKALEQIDVLRLAEEGPVLIWERVTTDVPRGMGGRGISSAIVALTDQAVYLAKGSSAVATARVPLDAISKADVSLWRPGFIRLELLGRDRVVKILACSSGDDQITVLKGEASQLLANEPFIIFDEAKGDFLRRLGTDLKGRTDLQ